MNENEEGDGEAVVETPAADAPAAWDGNVDSLLTQPWVPEDARPHLEKHLTTHREATARRDFLDQVFAADDRTAELTKQLETTKGELTSLKEALGKAEQEVTGYREKESAAERERRVVEWTAKYPDIFTEQHEYESEETPWHRAWDKFYDLIAAGYPEEKAAKMARAFLPEPPPGAAAAPPPAAAAPPKPPAERKVEVPPSVAGASRSSASPSTTVNAAEASETFDQRAARMEREETAKLKMGGR